jgi:hypothetical protein
MLWRKSEQDSEDEFLEYGVDNSGEIQLDRCLLIFAAKWDGLWMDRMRCIEGVPSLLFLVAL